MLAYYIDLAWRSLKRTPLVSALMVMAIAVGIGITMTSLSVYHMMSMDPIPSKSDKLFAVQTVTSDADDSQDRDRWNRNITYKDAMALYQADIPAKKVPMMRTGFSVHMRSGEVKPFLESARVTGRDFFSMFELSFIYGGPWSMEQEVGAAPVVVISEALNNTLFGGANSVGKEILLDEYSFQVIGVLQDWDIHIKYYDLTNGAFNDVENLFIPFGLLPALELPTWGNTNGWKFEEVNTFQERLASELWWIQFWAELPDAQAVLEYDNFIRDYMIEQGSLGRFESNDEPLYAIRDVSEWLGYNNVVSEDNQVLVGLSFMFLVVCLANILGLLLGKFLKRAPEVGVRRALGANKRQIFLQHLVEVSMLGLIGGIAGIGIAQLGLWGVRHTYDYYSALATMDLSMFLAAPVISIVACIIAGMYPAWLVCKTAPAIYLKTQ
ncbi:ABC transporter permease [Glaciecola sp. SC05]|uniref:ABC transporter permease n=1 Tax=Glaciecola sp. SC05 TaxID=1987355 RepID=UPI003527AF5F